MTATRGRLFDHNDDCI